MRILVLDVGNTRVGAACFEVTREVLVEARRFPAQAPDGGAALLDWVRAQSPEHGVLASVGRIGHALQSRLETAGLGLTAFHRGDEFPMPLDVEQPERVGVDRLAAALAAYTLTGGGALVADLGTAMTLDWVDDGGVFRGGAILPGRRLCAAALHQFTARLPDVGVRATEPVALPGRDPEQAIRAGLDRGLPGMVEAVLDELQRCAGRSLPVWITGGDAPWMMRRSRRTFRHEPDLVLRGLLAAWRRTVAP